MSDKNALRKPPSALVLEAAKYAEAAHAHQKRKYTGDPYFKHCEAVAHTVSLLDPRPEVVAAAYLHDTVEDTHITLDDIARNFGYDVAGLVSMVTDVSDKSMGNRAQRKAIDLQHLSRASSEGQSIKVADLMHNTHSIVAHDPKFAEVYLLERARLLHVLTKADANLLAGAKRQLSSFLSSIGTPYPVE